MGTTCLGPLSFEAKWVGFSDWKVFRDFGLSGLQWKECLAWDLENMIPGACSYGRTFNNLLFHQHIADKPLSLTVILVQVFSWVIPSYILKFHHYIQSYVVLCWNFDLRKATINLNYVIFEDNETSASRKRALTRIA